MNTRPEHLPKPLKSARPIRVEEVSSIPDHLVELSLQPGVLGTIRSHLRHPLFDIGFGFVVTGEQMVILCVGVGLLVGGLTLRHSRAKRKPLTES